jgi:hypothetical protein
MRSVDYKLIVYGVSATIFGRLAWVWEHKNNHLGQVIGNEPLPVFGMPMDEAVSVVGGVFVGLAVGMLANGIISLFSGRRN